MQEVSLQTAFFPQSIFVFHNAKIFLKGIIHAFEANTVAFQSFQENWMGTAVF